MTTLEKLKILEEKGLFNLETVLPYIENYENKLKEIIDMHDWLDFHEDRGTRGATLAVRMHLNELDKYKRHIYTIKIWKFEINIFKRKEG